MGESSTQTKDKKKKKNKLRKAVGEVFLGVELFLEPPLKKKTGAFCNLDVEKMVL